MHRPHCCWSGLIVARHPHRPAWVCAACMACALAQVAVPAADLLRVCWLGKLSAVPAPYLIVFSILLHPIPDCQQLTAKYMATVPHPVVGEVAR